MSKLYILSILILLSGLVSAQKDPEWDNTKDKVWPDEFKIAEIPSSQDNEIQKAYFYFPETVSPKPLVISLHTWSGDYTQKDPLVNQILEKKWNYIHPDFRGVNNTPKACGSEYVVSDIDDAIDYALKNANVDKKNIHIMGTSGGGFATMLSYMKSKHKIRTFSSWVGISDLAKWYYESMGRGNKYASHIRMVTTGDTISVNLDDAKKRSPLFMDTPVNKRLGSQLFLYCGIHDGYTGSVPISQTIDFYNKLVKDYQPVNIQSLVPEMVRETMLRQRNLPGIQLDEKLGGRKIIYQNSFKDLIYITVFEGTHEMIVEEGLSEISKILK